MVLLVLLAMAVFSVLVVAREHLQRTTVMAGNNTKISRSSKNTQDSHNQQNKQNHKINKCGSRTPKLKQVVNPHNHRGTT
jgi:hypothetical protein